MEELKLINQRARTGLDDGAVVKGVSEKADAIVKMLNQALATELVCIMRYKRHAEMADGIHSEYVAQEFLEHARDEQAHADRISKRIGELNGAPDYNPEGLAQRSATAYVECSSLKEMIRENLVAERIVIQVYKGMIQSIGGDDSTSRRMLEAILEDEEDHADELAKMLKAVGGSEMRTAAAS
jgi:bacterioferritin